MKKITILFLSVISAILLGGCENNPPIIGDSNLESHFNTIGALDTYTIKFEVDKNIQGSSTTNTNFIYVDNVNDTFAVSVYDKEDYSVLTTDLVFEYEDGKLYNYIYNDVWIKHEIDSKLLNFVEFENTVFEYFKNATTENIDGKIIYSADISINNIKDSGYTALGGNTSKEYYDIDIPITITFCTTEERFVKFELDFKPVMEAMNVDQGIETLEDDYWKVSFEYTKIDESFEIVISDYIFDDFIDDFDEEAFIGMTELYSFELIKGCVDYNEDKDLLKVEFEDSGLYQLSLRSYEEVDDLVVTILDSNHNIFRTFILNSKDSVTSYWNYTRGTYYVLVSGNLSDCSSADYSLLFMSN
ncbi:hypothetical protein KQ51_00719 [Candidatus Izimaplasma bacterium HR1]|uniref:hypothetical protein n=1 Tax=Candidatus Izimoplasma sp. HR1 TaxID=1541959 RepID=UPI0004F68277|nr:hypothetical protein KQ51_00719 [Candidatus Izimaplasma bacterium HR1]